MRLHPLEEYAASVLQTRAWLIGGGLTLACQMSPSSGASGAPQPELAAARRSLCDAPGAEQTRSSDVLPARPPGYCVDPHGLVTAYGSGSSSPLEQACQRVLGPECADGYGLDRVVTLRYLSAADVGSSVEVSLLRFTDAVGASAYYTDTLIGEADPATLELSALEVPGVAVLQPGAVFGWRGRHVLWLREADDRHAVDQEPPVAAASLPALAGPLLAGLPDDDSLPTALERLPTPDRVAFGARLMLGDALGVPGLGLSARGYYREGDKRWRVVTIARPDADAAKDVFSTLRRQPSARKIKGIAALELTERRLPAEPQVAWVIGQHGEVVYAVGDEASALPEHMPAREEANVKLSLHEKLVKLSRIFQQ